MAASNLDHAIGALALIRNAQRAVDAALRLPTEDRAALADQIDAVRRSSGDVASALASSVPGGQSLASAGQALGGGLASRPELRALGGLVSYFANQGSQALGAVAGAAASVGGERDQSLVLSERIAQRLGEVGVATRVDLARALDVDPRSAEFRDALERTLGTGHAEWYGSGTYGLPRAQLEMMIARAREVADEEPPAQDPVEASDAPSSAPPPPAPGARGLGASVGDLRASVDGLLAALARRSGPATEPLPQDPTG
jgi:hypothetical protein